MSDFYGWDDEIESDGSEFITLLPGKYTGKVTKVEKKRWEGNGKMNGCAYADVTIEIDAGDGRKAFISDPLYLARNVEFKIANFLTAFGLKKKNEPVKPSVILKALHKSCVVTVECQLGKDQDYKKLTAAQAQEEIEKGTEVYNKIKSYSALKDREEEESSDDEFGFGF